MATELTLVADHGADHSADCNSDCCADYSVGCNSDCSAGCNADHSAGSRPGTQSDRDSNPQTITFVTHPKAGCMARVRHRLRCLRREDSGAVTAEYAIVILAGVAFAGLLVAIMRSSEVREMLVRLVENALGTGSA